MKLEAKLDNIHSTVVQNKFLQLFTAVTRVLLAVGFIPPSIVKILHKSFTVLPDSNPVGHYFNALYNTGFYYEFLGWGQLIAAILLLIPRSAHLGALAFLPIILNIAVLTSSVGFKGTNYITALMFLASAYLVCWEYDRLKPLLFAKRAAKAQSFRLELLWLPIAFALSGTAMAGLWALIGLGNFPNYSRIALILAILGFVFGLIVALHHKFMPNGELRKSFEIV